MTIGSEMFFQLIVKNFLNSVKYKFFLVDQLLIVSRINHYSTNTTNLTNDIKKIDRMAIQRSRFARELRLNFFFPLPSFSSL